MNDETPLEFAREDIRAAVRALVAVADRRLVLDVVQAYEFYVAILEGSRNGPRRRGPRPAYTPTTASTGHPGVRQRGERFQARLNKGETVDGAEVILGTFGTLDEAVAERAAALASHPSGVAINYAM